MPERPDIRGLMMMWDKGPIPDQPGRHAVMAFGLIGMPEEVAKAYAGDSLLQRLVTGDEIPSVGLRLLASESEGAYAPEHYLMRRVDEILTAPIWRV